MCLKGFQLFKQVTYTSLRLLMPGTAGEIRELPAGLEFDLYKMTPRNLLVLSFWSQDLKQI